MVPVLLDVRVNVLNRKLTPYLSLSGGTVYNASKDFTNFGTMMGFGAGLAIKVTPKNMLSVGTTFEAVGLSDREYYMSEVWTGKYRSFGISAGITF